MGCPIVSARFSLKLKANRSWVQQYGQTPPYSETTATAIDDEIRRIIDDAHKQAHEIIEAHREQHKLIGGSTA